MAKETKKNKKKETKKNIVITILIIIALIQTVILVKQFVDDDCDYQPDVTVNDRNHLGE